MNDKTATTQDDLNTPAIAVVGFVSVVVVFVIIILLTVVFHSVNQGMERERLKSGGVLYPQISKLDTDQQGHLAMYDKVDQHFIPIKRAMQLVVAELSANPNAQVTGPAEATVVPPAEPTDEVAPEDETEPNMGGKEDER